MANPKIEHFARQDREKVREIKEASSSPSWLHRVSFEKGLEPVFVFDPSNRAILEVNQSAEELTGCAREELLDLRLEDLHPRGQRDIVVQYFQKILDHGNYIYDDLPLETKDQGNLPVEVKAGVLTSGGAIVVEALFRDISKERLLQQEVLFQNLKLSALNALSSAISKSFELTEILANSLRAIMEASGSTYGEMLIYREESNTFELVSHRGENLEPAEMELTLDTCPLASQALERGKPVLLEALDDDPRLAQIFSGKDEPAVVAGVPLRSKNRVLGVMHLVISNNQLFPTFDFDLFTSIGNQIGMAAENSLLFHHTVEQAKQLTVLYNISRTISSSLHIEEVFDSFAHETQKLIPFDRLSVASLEESGGYLRIVASGSRTDSGWGMESIIPLVGTGPGWVVLNETHFIQKDTEGQQQFIEDQFLYEDGIRSYILLPLEARRRVVGTFGLGSKERAAFSEKDLPLLSQLSKQISVAIENIKLYERTRETSILDDVSSLFNFHYFHQALDRELKLVARHKSRLSLIFIDLDHFKAINDKHGHLRGSQTLREIGFLLRAAIRETDIACRYGGDEFVVILPDTDGVSAKRLGERIRRIILQHTYLKEEGINARLGASIGIATYPNQAPTKEELIHLADEEMYRDKEANRGKPIPRDA